MDLETIILNKVKSDRERQIIYDITYMWNLKKNDTNGLIYKTETPTDIENRLLVTKGKVLVALCLLIQNLG